MMMMMMIIIIIIMTPVMVIVVHPSWVDLTRCWFWARAAHTSET